MPFLFIVLGLFDLSISLFVIGSYDIEDLFIFTNHIVIIASSVRKSTVRAILESLFVILEITSAVVP